jgi:hypothetical protein
MLEISESSDMMKHKVDFKYEDSTIESPPDNSISVSAKKVEEFKNTSTKKGSAQWAAWQLGISNPKDNSFTVTLANDGTVKSQALKRTLPRRGIYC